MTTNTLGPGGCCNECEIYLDYKDAYQCNNGECDCNPLSHTPTV